MFKGERARSWAAASNEQNISTSNRPGAALPPRLSHLFRHKTKWRHQMNNMLQEKKKERTLFPSKSPSGCLSEGWSLMSNVSMPFPTAAEQVFTTALVQVCSRKPHFRPQHGAVFLELPDKQRGPADKMLRLWLWRNARRHLAADISRRARLRGRHAAFAYYTMCTFIIHRWLFHPGGSRLHKQNSHVKTNKQTKQTTKCHLFFSWPPGGAWDFFFLFFFFAFLASNSFADRRLKARKFDASMCSVKNN